QIDVGAGSGSHLLKPGGLLHLLRGRGPILTVDSLDRVNELREAVYSKIENHIDNNDLFVVWQSIEILDDLLSSLYGQVHSLVKKRVNLVLGQGLLPGADLVVVQAHGLDCGLCARSVQVETHPHRRMAFDRATRCYRSASRVVVRLIAATLPTVNPCFYGS